jgi:hypothetical protein
LAKVEATKPMSTGQISPPDLPPTMPVKSGYVKVRLSYLTHKPKHVRSILLRQYGTQPPYIEDVCILMPRMKVFALLETFMPAFEELRAAGVIDKEASLQTFTILDEDVSTLAYIV